MQSVPQNLPVGWRFQPTNEELLDHYLKNKRLGLPISGSDIQDIQICDFDPWDLIDKNSRSKERYIFCRRQFHLKTGGIQRKRKAKAGFWKRTGEVQFITREDSDEVIGTKTIFVYHDPTPTEFVKHEYELTEELDSPVQDDHDFVLCKLMIIKKKKASKKPKKVKKEGTINSKQIEVDSEEKEALNSNKARNCLSDTASVSVSYNQRQDNLVVDSAFAQDEPGNRRTYSIFAQDEPSNRRTYSNFAQNEPSNQTSNRRTYSNFGQDEPSNRTSNRRTHSAFGEGESINHLTLDSENQAPVTMTAKSTCEKGASSHGGARDFEYQIKEYQMSNTLVYDKDSTSFLMDSDNIQNSKEISIFSRYSMSVTSSQMAANLENRNPNDMTAISLHQSSFTWFENQNPNEITVVSTQKNVETSCLVKFDFENSHQNDTTLHSAYCIQNDTTLYSASCNQNEPSYPVTFHSENQNPSKETNISASLEGRYSLLQETPLDFGAQNQYEKPDRLDSEWSVLLASSVLETEFEEVESCYKKTDISDIDDLEAATFPELSSQMLDELMALDDPQDTLCSKPTQPKSLG